MSKTNKNSRFVSSHGVAKMGGKARKENAKYFSGLKSDGDAAFHASKGSSARPDRKVRTQNPLYYVVRKFKIIFGSYDSQSQNTENKRLALNLAIGLCRNYYPDQFRFWQDLRDEANVLLDSKRFCSSCEAWSLNPQSVAEHLVVEGKTTLNMVLKQGLQAYGEKARMFKDPLYIDERGLYGEPQHASSSDTTNTC